MGKKAIGELMGDKALLNKVSLRKLVYQDSPPLMRTVALPSLVLGRGQIILKGKCMLWL